MTAQGRLIKVHVEQPRSMADGKESNNGGPRGTIYGFSKASRKRMFELVARIDLDRFPSVFITLTYPAEFPTLRQSKPHLRAFLERLRRRDPESSGIWRLEVQQRGAPHYHLLLWNVEFWPKDEVQDAWGEIIAYERPFTRIELIQEPRKVVKYVAKYMAKRGKEGDGGVQICDTIKPTEAGDAEGTGRWWGVFNRARLPFAPLTSLEKPFDTWYHTLRSLASREWSALDPADEQGFALFVDEANYVLGRWLEFCENSE